MTEKDLNFAESLRALANMVDQHPEIADWFPHVRLSHHLIGKDAAVLDRFAELFGVPVEHDQEPNPNTNKFYSEVATDIGALHVRLQCVTPDYERATGKAVDRTLAEAEHWAANPLPRDLGATP